MELLSVDAAIIFSDILVIPQAMGLDFELVKGVGPRFAEPVRSPARALGLPSPDLENLRYVLDAIEVTRRSLSQGIPLIGFAGSPWTLFCYMVEGEGSKHFARAKRFIYESPEEAHNLLEKLARGVARFIEAQVEAGADAVQLFDTWGGILTQSTYREFSLPYLERITQLSSIGSAPLILYSKGVHHAVRELADTGADVLSVDWTMDLGAVRRETEGRVALQGNLDPVVLLADTETIRREVDRVLASVSGSPGGGRMVASPGRAGDTGGYIFNLGHGILPETPPENAKFLVDYVKSMSREVVLDV